MLGCEVEQRSGVEPLLNTEQSRLGGASTGQGAGPKPSDAAQ